MNKERFAIEFEARIKPCNKIILKFINQFPYMEAEDLHQEGLIVLYDCMKIHDEKRSAFTTYFYNKVYFRFLDLHYKFVKQVKSDLHFKNAPLSYVPNKEIDPFLLDDILKVLNPEQKNWVRYYLIEDLSYKEIALIENTSIQDIKNRARAAKKKIKPIIDDFMGRDFI
ncbi:RNA polymerase sigma factor [Thalassobacillus pellis]|uniref:RNA polymerase sigma factor n=1 Tax=Thalassobacillus pellis TaxID=748008 RepID=UPI0019615F45|nr:sigma-70 family RNA polymerase sigma factor [Thalassobacillus pellis]MBM7551657.1 RNA polymerase sigma factor (sigma-70 family) [Thalassobacillus pellis]